MLHKITRKNILSIITSLRCKMQCSFHRAPVHRRITLHVTMYTYYYTILYMQCIYIYDMVWYATVCNGMYCLYHYNNRFLFVHIQSKWYHIHTIYIYIMAT